MYILLTVLYLVAITCFIKGFTVLIGKTKRAIRRSGELEYEEFTRLDNNK